MMACGLPALVLPMGFLQAQEASPAAVEVAEAVGYDALETLPADSVLAPELQRGPGYAVGTPIVNDGYFGAFRLSTEYGVFECHGREMLVLRIDELRAIRQLDQINKGEVFLKSVGVAVAKPVGAVAGMVKDPVGTVHKLPSGMAGLFKRAGDAVAKGADNLQRNLDSDVPLPAAGAPKAREDIFGFNKNRNIWAAELKVDPYTSNPVLAEKLTQMAAVAFTTEMVAGFGIGAVAAPLSIAGNVDSFVLNQPPAKVKDRVASELVAMGCAKPSVDAFVAVPWFTPTLQVRFTNALGRLKGTGNLNAAVQLAANCETEVQARFLCASLEALGNRRATSQPFRKLVAIAPLPGVVLEDGSLLVCAPVDVLPWIPTTEAFVKRATGYPKTQLALNGAITLNARKGLAANGWVVGK